MQLRRFESATEFYQQANCYLLKHETKHTLLLGVLNDLIHHPQLHTEPPYLAIVEAAETVAVAITTPPHPLLLSQAEDLAAIGVIAHDLHNQQLSLSEVNAPTAESLAFVEIWKELTGCSYQLRMALRSHCLEVVQPIARAKGCLRSATPADQERLLWWHDAFVAEGFGESPQEGEGERWLTGCLQRGSIYLWQDEKPVSFANGRRVNDRSGWIGPVYTPPEYRNRGYATSCVAALSQHLLDQGCQFCFLFTDMNNPTSNKIYPAIGYQPICDWNNYRFINTSADGGSAPS